MQQTYQPIDARPMPGQQTGAIAWLKTNLFSSVGNSLITVGLLAVALWALAHTLGWSVTHAVFGANLEACNNMRGIGACWGVVTEKGRLIVMGRYPDTEHWRPVIATALMLGVVGISCMPRFWNKTLPLIWLVMLVVYFTLMKGGVPGLTEVPTDQWGGLPLTVMLTVVSMTMAFPLQRAARCDLPGRERQGAARRDGQLRDRSGPNRCCSGRAVRRREGALVAEGPGSVAGSPRFTLEVR